MKSIKKIYFEDRVCEIFEEGAVILRYLDDETENTWNFREKIISVDFKSSPIVWISTETGLNYYMDISKSLIFLHQE
jgi:hypothetical protein